MAFPYNEMVQEWNGSWVHTSEFEPKHPQLEPLPIVLIHNLYNMLKHKKLVLLFL